MRPEDIDKLFKDRLDNSTPTPPADLWSRLQERIETEMPQQEKPIMMVQPKEKTRSFIWLYSSIAAAVSLVLTVGVVFYNVKTTPEVSGSLAHKEQTQHIPEAPVALEPISETIAQAEAQKELENFSGAQATEQTKPASKVTEEIIKVQAVASTSTRKPVTKKAPETKAVDKTMENKPVVANNSPVETSAPVTPDVKPVTPGSLAVASPSANMNAEPVEIIIKRAITSQPTPAEAEEPTSMEKKGLIAKNIFKQVKNIASGEPVELSEIVRADRISLQTQIGKQKISKVINL